MADLSSLLNPAPSPVKGDQVVGDTAMTALHMAEHQANIYGHTKSDTAAQSPPQLQKITSPGLEALAAAASEIAPLVSPIKRDFASQGFPSSVDQAQQVQTRHVEPFQNGYTEYERKLEIPIPSQNATLPSQPQKFPEVNSAPIFPHGRASSANDQVEVKAEKIESPVERETPLQVHHLYTEFTPSQINRRIASPGTPLRTVTNVSTDPATSEEPSSMAPKKRGPAPKKRGAPRKGTAVRPPAKKRKVEEDSVSGSPSGPRTGTPATSRASNTPVPRGTKRNSATPTRSSSILNGNDEDHEEEEDDEDDDNLLYCICRKPDDHSVMIGCDGPCGDWFHTRCVDMNSEKVELIFKWYCPNCSAEGHETLWKRKCRLEDCNKPARTDQESKNKSKYCSDEHGVEFIQRRIFGGHQHLKATPSTNRKRGKKEIDGHENGVSGHDSSADDDYEHPRGGVLRPEELKALTYGVKDFTAFKRLGEGVFDPSEDNSTTNGDFKRANVSYTADEATTLEAIDKQRKELESRRDLLLDRDKFIAMVAARARTVLAEMKEKEKEKEKDKAFTICGYDSRLTWTDFEFNNWRASEEGQRSFRMEALQPTSSANGHDAAGKMQVDLVNGEANKDTEEGEIGPGVCKKRRCERHRAWLKLQHQDNALEKDEVHQCLQRLDAEEKDVKDRAIIRTLEGLGD